MFNQIYINNCSSRLEKNFVFLGIINDCEKHKRNFKLVFKKVLKKYK